MKIDLYTKTVLTIIAFSLIIIASQSFIPRAIAQHDNQIQNVALVRISNDVSQLHVVDEEVIKQLKKIVSSTDRTCKDLGFKFCAF